MKKAILFSAVFAAGLSGCGMVGPYKGQSSSAQADVEKKPQGASTPTVKLDGAKQFRKHDTFFVPTLIVKFPYEGKVSVSKQGSAMSGIGKSGGSNSVKASAEFKVEGLSRDLLQSIVKQAYDDFVAQLKGSGYKVITWDEVKDQDMFKGVKVESVDAKWNLPEDDGSLIVGPTDGQAFKPGMGGNYVAPFQSFGKGKIPDDSTLLVPVLVINAPQVWGVARSGYGSISAAVNAAPGMNLQSGIVWMLTKEGGWGSVKLQQEVVNLSENVGTLVKEDKTSTAGNAFSKGLSMLSGSGSITGAKARYTLTVDSAAYSAGASNGLKMFNAEAAKAIAATKQ